MVLCSPTLRIGHSRAALFCCGVSLFGVVGCSLAYTPPALDPGSEDAGSEDPDAHGSIDGAVDDTDLDMSDDAEDIDPCVTDRQCGQPANCLQILTEHPGVENGNYLIWVDSVAVEVTCDMVAGGWTRTVVFDAQTDPCPAGWEPQKGDAGGISVCELGGSDCGSGSAKQALFFTPLAAYTEVRGTVLGYQGNSTDGFGTAFDGIDEPYVDGVSITVGQPRAHVWTLASGLRRDVAGNQSCPCVGGDAPPPFVGQNYFCDSGNPTDGWERTWYIEDPLWDLGDCGNATDGWFQTALASATREPLEVRLMADGCDDDFGILSMELYVR